MTRDSEYQSLRNEILTRTTLINNQASTAIVTVISSWVAGITLLGFAVNKNIDPYNLIWVCIIASLVFLMPILYFIPLAVKSGENLQQIASISVYIRVFYEYPTISASTPTVNILNWEISNSLMDRSIANLRKSSLPVHFYNGEYTILSAISLALYGICAAFTSTNIFSFCGSSYNWGVILSILGFVAIGFFGLVGVVKIHKLTNIKDTFMDHFDTYIDAYIRRAQELNIIALDDTLAAEKLRSNNAAKTQDAKNPHRIVCEKL